MKRQNAVGAVRLLCRLAAFGPVLAVALTAGCGAGAIELTREEYDRLPREYRQEIFDAENDVVIARNRFDEATERAASAERALTDLGPKWERTSQRLSRSRLSAMVPSAHNVYDMNVACATALVDVAHAAIRKAEVDARLSRARLHLVRQRQLARIGRATLASLKPLEDAVADLERSLKVASSEEVESRARVQTRLNAWKSAEDRYVAATGDYDTGVWGD
jgi:hypothetical protein